MALECYCDRHFDALLEVWNASLTADAIDAANLCRRVLWDLNFDPSKLLLYMEGVRALGFAYGVVRAVPDEIAGMETGSGYIVAMGVRPEARGRGVGRELLEGLEQALRGAGAARIRVGPYATNYICPGVDYEAYPEGVAFLKACGYISSGTSVSMDTDLHGYRYPSVYAAKKAELEKQGYCFREFEPRDTVATLNFLRAEFPHWTPAVRGAMNAMLPGGLIIAADPEGAVIGFVMRALDGTPERFGPFGVAASQQGKSIGSLLFHEMMLSMQKARIFHTYFLWTTGRNLDFYGHWGMKVYRTYEMLGKTFEQDERL